MKRYDTTVKDNFETMFGGDRFRVILTMTIHDCTLETALDEEIPNRLHGSDTTSLVMVGTDGCIISYEDKFLREVHILREVGDDIEYEIRQDLI